MDGNNVHWTVHTAEIVNSTQLDKHGTKVYKLCYHPSRKPVDDDKRGKTNATVQILISYIYLNRYLR